MSQTQVEEVKFLVGLYTRALSGELTVSHFYCDPGSSFLATVRFADAWLRNPVPASACTIATAAAWRRVLKRLPTTTSQAIERLSKSVTGVDALLGSWHVCGWNGWNEAWEILDKGTRSYSLPRAWDEHLARDPSALKLVDDIQSSIQDAGVVGPSSGYADVAVFNLVEYFITSTYWGRIPESSALVSLERHLLELQANADVSMEGTVLALRAGSLFAHVLDKAWARLMVYDSAPILGH